MGIGFVKYIMQCYLVKIEQELNCKIYCGNCGVFVEFDIEIFECGDLKLCFEVVCIVYG